MSVLIRSEIRRQLWNRQFRDFSNVLDRSEFGDFGDGLEEAFEKVEFGGKKNGGRGSKMEYELVEGSGADVFVKVELAKDVESEQALVKTE